MLQVSIDVPALIRLVLSEISHTVFNSGFAEAAHNNFALPVSTPRSEVNMELADDRTSVDNDDEMAASVEYEDSDVEDEETTMELSSDNDDIASRHVHPNSAEDQDMEITATECNETDNLVKDRTSKYPAYKVNRTHAFVPIVSDSTKDVGSAVESASDSEGQKSVFVKVSDRFKHR